MRALIIFFVLAIAGCDNSKKIDPIERTEVEQNQSNTQLKLKPEQAKNFNVDLISLPENFNPDDEIKIIDHLNTLHIKKDKYETTSEFKKKLKELSGTILYDEVSLDGYFAFNGDESISYNPDTEVASFDFYSFSGLKVSKRNLSNDDTKLCHSSSINSWTRHYKEKEFKKIQAYEEVAIIDGRLSKSKTLTIIAKSKIPLAKAKEADKSLGILITGKFLPPYLSEYCNLPKDYQDNELVVRREINFNIEEIWIYNKNTGEIFSKIPFKKLIIKSF